MLQIKLNHAKKFDLVLTISGGEPVAVVSRPAGQAPAGAYASEITLARLNGERVNRDSLASWLSRQGEEFSHLAKTARDHAIFSELYPSARLPDIRPALYFELALDDAIESGEVARA